MSFLFDEKYEQERHLFGQVAQQVAEPLAQEIDENGRFPDESIRQLSRYGMMGIPFPEKWGGRGKDALTLVLAVEALSQVCAATGVIVSTHIALASEPVYQYGNEGQKQKYLIPLAKGEALGAFALTEPNAGTDVSGIETTALCEGDHYLINGSKCFITNGGKADVYLVFAKMANTSGKSALSAFLVEKGTPGLVIGKRDNKMGIRGAVTATLFFENCRIPRANLLGQEGQGYEIAMKTLDGGRICIAAQALGIAQGAFSEAVAYVKKRKQFGKAIASFQNTKFQLADMKVRIEASRLLVYRAAKAKADKCHFAEEAAMAKLYASETAMFVTQKSIQLMGGYGYMKECPVERMMRDAKITEIYEGTNEVQRMIIAGGI